MEAVTFWKIFGVTFGTIFLAELGDKTQLATMAFAADNTSAKLAVFTGAAAALVLTTLIGVAFGDWIAGVVPAQTIRIGAAILFIGIGIFMLFTAFSPKARAYSRIRSEIIRQKDDAVCGNCIRFNRYVKELNQREPGLALRRHINQDNLTAPCGRGVCSTENIQALIPKTLTPVHRSQSKDHG